MNVIEKYNMFFDDEIIFMNDGYLDIDENGDPIIPKLDISDELIKWKYQVNLYKKVLDQLSNHSGNIVELSCGKGGGLKFIDQNYNFSKIIGVDINSNHCDVAKKLNPSIEVILTDATDLSHIETNSVDSVITIEAFSYYFPYEKYISEVSRILKTGGKLIQASPIETNFIKNKFSFFMKNFEDKNLKCENVLDITKNVGYSCAITKHKMLDNDNARPFLIEDEKRIVEGTVHYFIFNFVKENYKKSNYSFKPI